VRVSVLIKYFKVGVCGALLVLPSAMAHAQSAADELTFYGETYPPFSYMENGAPTGYSVDLLAEMLAHLDAKTNRSDINIVPWARGYAHLRRDPNVVLFSATRTPIREDLFKWVCPIAPYVRVLIAAKENRIKINSLEELKGHVYGVVRDDNSEQVLKSLGVAADKMHYVDKAISAAKMMVYKRLQVWATAKHTYADMLVEIGANPDDYEIVYEFEALPMCYAFSKDTSDETVSLMQGALDKVRASKRFEQIKAQYGF
jgi:polar amino acid transport system substrate-binding protein